MNKSKHPIQPVVIDFLGTIRFKENVMVRKLLDFSTANGYGLNAMACEDFSVEDRQQLAQLIGYSVSGYGTLSYVDDDNWDEVIISVDAMHDKLKEQNGVE